LSARYSGTYSAALNAAELAEHEMPNFPVRAVDTGGLAMTHGFAVLAAARAAEAGAALDDAARQAQRIGKSARLVGMLDTMRYLARGGRVPWIVHWAASILRIKPVLAFDGEDARSVARVRTAHAGTRAMLRYVGSTTTGGPLRVAVMQTGAEPAAGELACAVRERFGPLELITTEFTSVMAVHTGPGFLGLAVVED
jgi:DegV family protein with EDD domain